MSELSLDFLKQELEKDVKINSLALADELLQNAYLYSKWANYMADVRIYMIKASNDVKTVTAERLNYYTGRSHDEICDFVYQNATELKIAIAADSYVIRAETKLELYDTMLTLILRAMDSIKGRGFDIKAAMEQRQFEQGK